MLVAARYGVRIRQMGKLPLGAFKAERQVRGGLQHDAVHQANGRYGRTVDCLLAATGNKSPLARLLVPHIRSANY